MAAVTRVNVLVQQLQVTDLACTLNSQEIDVRLQKKQRLEIHNDFMKGLELTSPNHILKVGLQIITIFIIY